MSKIDDIKEKYLKVPSKTIDSFASSDITNTQKYLEYMVKLYSARNMYGYGSKEIKAEVLKFNTLLPYLEDKDIYSSTYNTYEKLCDKIKIAEEIREEKCFVREDHIDIIEETDDYIFLSPKTHLGSMKYGKGTRWCTAGKSSKYTYDNYTRSGSLFYFINKKAEGGTYSKIAFHISNHNTIFANINIFNAIDSSVSSDTLLKYGFTVEQLCKYDLLMKLYCLNRAKQVKLENNVNRTITQIKSINLEDLFTKIETLSGYKNQSKLNESQEVVNQFVKKLSEMIK
jgi:hypothetical protein